MHMGDHNDELWVNDDITKSCDDGMLMIWWRYDEDMMKIWYLKGSACGSGNEESSVVNSHGVIKENADEFNEVENDYNDNCLADKSWKDYQDQWRW